MKKIIFIIGGALLLSSCQGPCVCRAPQNSVAMKVVAEQSDQQNKQAEIPKMPILKQPKPLLKK